MPVVGDSMNNKIKELAKQVNIQESDGYMVNIFDDHDGMMRICPEQFDSFCKKLIAEIVKLTDSSTATTIKNYFT